MNTSKKFKQDILKNIWTMKQAEIKNNKRSIHEKTKKIMNKVVYWSKCNFELVEKEQIMAAMMMILSSVKNIARKLWV